MNVSDIIARVAEFSLDETDSENILVTRIVNDLNEIYKEVVQAAADSDNDNLEDSDLTLLNGSVAMPEGQCLVALVQDKDNRHRELKRADRIWLEQRYPGLPDTGSPAYYWVSKNNTLNAYPANSANIKVFYYPTPNLLTSDSLEADIMVPPRFHQVLVDGCIWYMKMREQGFHNENDRKEAQTKYEMSKDDYLAAVEARTRHIRRVQYYDF